VGSIPVVPVDPVASPSGDPMEIVPVLGPITETAGEIPPPPGDFPSEPIPTPEALPAPTETEISGAGQELPVVNPLPSVPQPRQLTSFYSPNMPMLGEGAYAYMTNRTTQYNMSHHPDVFWIPKADWDNSTWDGVTVWDPRKIGIAAACKGLFPTGNRFVMRGLHQLYYQIKPFADPDKPTIPEIEAWNLEVIRLFRRLMGITTPIENSRPLFLRAHWSDEQKYTRMWEAKAGYSCVGNPEPHCGAPWIPSCEDQKPYLYPDEACVKWTDAAENIHTLESDWPWAIKLARLLYGQLCGNGLTGHGGPWVSRTQIGYSFKQNDNGWTTTMRVKFSGAHIPVMP
jgi:hypothetical protein